MTEYINECNLPCPDAWNRNISSITTVDIQEVTMEPHMLQSRNTTPLATDTNRQPCNTHQQVILQHTPKKEWSWTHTKMWSWTHTKLWASSSHQHWGPFTTWSIPNSSSHTFNSSESVSVTTITVFYTVSWIKLKASACLSETNDNDQYWNPTCLFATTQFWIIKTFDFSCKGC